MLSIDSIVKPMVNWLASITEFGVAIVINAVGVETDFDIYVITIPCLSTRGITWGVEHAYIPLSIGGVFIPSVQPTKINHNLHEQKYYGAFNMNWASPKYSRITIIKQIILHKFIVVIDFKS